jgi:hypothetical protein
MSSPTPSAERPPPAQQAFGSHQHSVQWIREGSTDAEPVRASLAAKERSERSAALIVIVLTLACTAMAIFDLYLLATGVS